MPEINFEEFEVLKYKWPDGRWIEIDITENGYIFDCDQFSEEIVFKTTDDLLYYLELNNLLDVLTVKDEPSQSNSNRPGLKNLTDK